MVCRVPSTLWTGSGINKCSLRLQISHSLSYLAAEGNAGEPQACCDGQVCLTSNLLLDPKQQAISDMYRRRLCWGLFSELVKCNGCQHVQLQLCLAVRSRSQFSKPPGRPSVRTRRPTLGGAPTAWRPPAVCVRFWKRQKPHYTKYLEFSTLAKEWQVAKLTQATQKEN